METIFLAKKHIKTITKDFNFVKGIGISEDNKGKDCVLVNISIQATDTEVEKIPEVVFGHPIIVQRQKGFKAQSNQEQKDLHLNIA